MIVLTNRERLINNMSKQGMTQTQLAEKSGVSKATISAILCGTRNPSPQTALKICKLTKANFEDYFFAESVHK